MDNFFKRAYLSVTAAVFAVGLAHTAMALTVQDPDNETSMISVHTDVYVAPTNNASYSDSEHYRSTRDDGNDKSAVSYVKEYSATNGEIHVVSDFNSSGSADESTPNIKTSNKITFDTNHDGLNAGTFTGLEKIGYQRCQPAQDIDYSTFCGSSSSSLAKAQGDIAMGSSFNVQSAAITTMSDVTAIGDKTALVPSMNYSIDVRGISPDGYYSNAIGSVSAGMEANTFVYGNGGDSATSSESYSNHSSASGMIQFAKDMHYNSVINNAKSLTTNFDRVP
jgi:hypothetical protein